MQPLFGHRGTFSLSEQSPWTLYWDELRPLLENGLGHKLRERLDELGDNVKCVAWRLLESVCTMLLHERKPVSHEILRDLLQRDLPQEELLYFIWRCLIEKHCSLDVLRIVTETRPDLLELHMDFRGCDLCPLFSGYTIDDHDVIIGFPLTCVALSFLPDESECLERMRVLMELGADVNARHRDESTPIHIAAERGAWNVVYFLLQYGANIDLRIGEDTTRTLIAKSRPELVQTIPIHPFIPPSPLSLMYDALYSFDEDRFVFLLQELDIDVNFHNGRETLLQLAVKQRYTRAVTELINNGADLNLMAGLSTEPIILALNNPNFECLDIFVKHRLDVNLRFWRYNGNFLHVLAERWEKNENAKSHRTQFYRLIKEAIRQRVNVAGQKDREDKSLAYGFHKDPKLFHLLLDHGGFLSISDKVIMQTAPDIFVRFFDDKITYISDGKEEYIRVNYGFLQSQDCSSDRAAEMLPFYEMCKSKHYRQTVLLHPLVNLFLIYKWRKIAFIYIANFVLYALFTATFSVHVYQLTRRAYDQKMNTTINENTTTTQLIEHPYILFISIIFWSLLLLRELFQMTLSVGKYLRRKENWVEIILLASSFLTFLPAFRDVSFVLALAVSLTYVELTLLISRNPSTGTYITMFFRISLKTVFMLLIFSSFASAFVFSLFVFFYEGENGMIRSLWDSILHLAGMAVGEVNIMDLNFQSVASELTFLATLVFVTVVLMNLLNALAVSDTQSVMREAAMLCCVANVKHYTRIESMFLGYDPDNCQNRSSGFGPRQDGSLLSTVRAFFCVNVLPFPNSKKCLFDLTETGNLMIKIKRRGYYPHPYVDKFFDLCSIKLIFKYIYYRILLRCNEDTIIDEIVKSHKYRAPKRPNEDLYRNITNIQKELDLIRIQQKELRGAMENLMEKMKIHDEAREKEMKVIEEFRKSQNAQMTELRNAIRDMTSALSRAMKETHV